MRSNRIGPIPSTLCLFLCRFCLLLLLCYSELLLTAFTAANCLLRCPVLLWHLRAQMLRTHKELLPLSAVVDFNDVRATSLSDDRSGSAVKSAVRHSLVNARVNPNMHLLAHFKALNHPAYRRKTTLSHTLPQLPPRLLPRTVMPCHFLSFFFIKEEECGEER